MENVTKASNWIRNVWNNLAEGEAGTVLTYVTLGVSGACKTEGKRNCTEVQLRKFFPSGVWLNDSENVVLIQCNWTIMSVVDTEGSCLGWEMTNYQGEKSRRTHVVMDRDCGRQYKHTFRRVTQRNICVCVWDVRVSTHAFPCPDSLEGLEAMTLR